VADRPNLSILTSTIITRLLFDQSSSGEKTVKAVEIAQDRSGPRYLVKGTKEVLLCLGSYNSPQLLQASGVGGAEDLKKIGVKTKVELEGVGRGLRDHLMAGPVYKAAPGTSTQYLMSDIKGVGFNCLSGDVLS
jgi:choline dehydrogenase